MIAAGRDGRRTRLRAARRRRAPAGSPSPTSALCFPTAARPRAGGPGCRARGCGSTSRTGPEGGARHVRIGRISSGRGGRELRGGCDAGTAIATGGLTYPTETSWSRYQGASNPSPKRQASERRMIAGPTRPRERRRAEWGCRASGPTGARARCAARGARGPARTDWLRPRGGRGRPTRGAPPPGPRSAPRPSRCSGRLSRRARRSSQHREDCDGAIEGDAGHSPAPAARGSAGRGGPAGQAPSEPKHLETRPTKTQKISRLRSARTPAAAGSAAGGRSANRSTTADQIGQEQGDQHELDRPAAHHPVSDPDVARRCRAPARAPDRARPSSSWAARPSWPSFRVSSRGGAVAEAGGWPVAAGRERDRRDPGGEERPLLVERERERQIDELREEARCRRRAPVCSSNAPAPSRRASAGERGRSPASSSRGGPGPASASRLTTATMLCGAARSREAHRPEAAVVAGVGREKDERVGGRDACSPPSPSGRMPARARSAPRSRSRCRSRRARPRCRPDGPSPRSHRATSPWHDRGDVPERDPADPRASLRPLVVASAAADPRRAGR